VVSLPQEEIPRLSNFDSIAPTLFGTSRENALDGEEYSRAIDLTHSYDFWYEVAQDYARLYRDSSVIEAFSSRFEVFGQLLLASISEETDRRVLLAEHFTIAQLQNWVDPNIVQNTLFPGLIPLPILLNNWLQVEEGGSTIETLERNDLSTGAFLLGLKVQSIGARPSYKVRQALEDLYEYDIPFGNSPDMSSLKLGELIKNPRKMLLIPLVTAAFLAAGQMEQGDYAGAIETSATGGAAYIALEGSRLLPSLVENAVLKNPRANEEAGEERQRGVDDEAE
jgi:hypothetical protein